MGCRSGGGVDKHSGGVVGERLDGDVDWHLGGGVGGPLGGTGGEMPSVPSLVDDVGDAGLVLGRLSLLLLPADVSALLSEACGEATLNDSESAGAYGDWKNGCRNQESSCSASTPPPSFDVRSCGRDRSVEGISLKDRLISEARTAAAATSAARLEVDRPNC